MSERCPDCGYPVGWDRLAGECPRNMQNYQSEDCKARQMAALRSRIAKLEAVVEAARRVNDVGASDDFCALETALEQLDAKAELEKVER